MAKRQYPWWIKERHNPQLGVYYIEMGQMSKAAAKRAEGSIYGHNYMLRFETQQDYEAKLDELRKAGNSVQ